MAFKRALPHRTRITDNGWLSEAIKALCTGFHGATGHNFATIFGFIAEFGAALLGALSLRALKMARKRAQE